LEALAVLFLAARLLAVASFGVVPLDGLNLRLECIRVPIQDRVNGSLPFLIVLIVRAVNAVALRPTPLPKGKAVAIQLQALALLAVANYLPGETFVARLDHGGGLGGLAGVDVDGVSPIKIVLGSLQEVRAHLSVHFSLIVEGVLAFEAGLVLGLGAVADDLFGFLAAALEVLGEGPFEAAQLLLAAPLLPAAGGCLHLPKSVGGLLKGKLRRHLVELLDLMEFGVFALDVSLVDVHVLHLDVQRGVHELRLREVYLLDPRPHPFLLTLLMSTSELGPLRVDFIAFVVEAQALEIVEHVLVGIEPLSFHHLLVYLLESKALVAVNHTNLGIEHLDVVVLVLGEETEFGTIHSAIHGGESLHFIIIDHNIIEVSLLLGSKVVGFLEELGIFHVARAFFHDIIQKF